MKIATLDNPVRASWLTDQGFRLDPSPFVSAGYAARRFLQQLPHTEPLRQVSTRIFHPGRFRRHWTIYPKHGVPFLGSADIFEADLSSLPMITKSSFAETSRLPLEPGWTLITCSGMTAGRVTYARLSMRGYACSQDVMRVVPDQTRIPAGYLYTFLASPFGIPVIKGGIYGTSVRHIEPEHIADLPVPRLGDPVENRIDALIREAMELRQRFEDGVCSATQDLFESAGIPELLDLRWHDRSGDLDFSVNGLTPSTLRALNFAPRAKRILDKLKSTNYSTLGEICRNGDLSRGNRFKRLDSNLDHGVRLVGQRQGFWLRPEGRLILLTASDAESVRAVDETVLIASQGTLGETEVFCRPLLATGSWLEKYVFSEHFLRVVSGNPEFPGAYLFAFLRSEPAFRVLRSMSTGSKQQDINPLLRAALPVPECTPSDRERIAKTVRRAYRDRDEADRKEDLAFTLLDEAVREAAR